MREKGWGRVSWVRGVERLVNASRMPASLTKAPPNPKADTGHVSPLTDAPPQKNNKRVQGGYWWRWCRTVAPGVQRNAGRR